jgi:hypothetical protein
MVLTVAPADCKVVAWWGLVRSVVEDRWLMRRAAERFQVSTTITQHWPAAATSACRVTGSV